MSYSPPFAVPSRRFRLASISGPVPATFVYDSTGRRARKTINGTTTDFLYDDVNPIQEVSGAAAASLLTGPGIDEYFVRADASGASALLTDALGSTVADCFARTSHFTKAHRRSHTIP